MTVRIVFPLICSTMLFSGCAAKYVAPQSVPTAVLEDYITQENENEGSALICYAKSIDGIDTVNALGETRARSQGTGKHLNVYLTDRKVAVGVHDVVLRCDKVYARPIDALLKGTKELEGSVKLEFLPSVAYEVRADLDAEPWAIYIRDAKTKKPVSDAVYGMPK